MFCCVDATDVDVVYKSPPSLGFGSTVTDEAIVRSVPSVLRYPPDACSKHGEPHCALERFHVRGHHAEHQNFVNPKLSLPNFGDEPLRESRDRSHSRPAVFEAKGEERKGSSWVMRVVKYRKLPRQHVVVDNTIKRSFAFPP
jgi:hypothetical protein